MKFAVAANFEVDFLDSEDDAGRGILTLRRRVEGTIDDAADEDDARRRVRDFITTHFPVRWALRVGRIRAEPVP